MRLDPRIFRLPAVPRHLRGRTAVAAAFTVAALGIAGAVGAQAGGPGRGFGPELGFGPGAGVGPRGLDIAGIDADGNGTLSRAELIDRARVRLAKADANGDGDLDRAELIVALPHPGGALVDIFGVDPAAERADRILAFFGATEAGRVPVTVVAERRADMLLTLLDADRDGVISAEEAAAAAGPRDRKPGHDHFFMRDHGPERGPRGEGGPRGNGPGEPMPFGPDEG